MTDDQAHAVGRLVKNYSHRGPVTITVASATFDLPDSYVTFRLETEGAQPLYGGISPEGDVST